MGFFGDILGTVLSPIKDIASVATGALGNVVGSVTKPMQGMLQTVLAPVTHLEDAVASVAKTGIQTAGSTVGGLGNMVGNTVGSLGHDVQGIVSPLTQGLGGGIKDIGGGIASLTKMLPYAAIGGLGLFLVMEMNDQKRGGGGYIGPAMKRMRR